MDIKTNNELKKCDEAIAGAKALLSRKGYPDDLRTVLAVGFIDQAIEHHAAVFLLARSGLVGSGFALARSVFESLFRGVWLLICATDAQVTEFEKQDRLPLNMPQMAEAIDKKIGADFFVDFVNRAWKSMNSYTHTGVLQLGRRFTAHALQPAYTDAEILEVTTTITTCVLLLIRPFFVFHKQEEEAKEVDRLVETYGPAASAC